MNNVNRRALDITLAVEARAKYAAMLSAEDRRRSYILTENGREALAAEYRRLCAQAADYCRVFGAGAPK